MKKPIIGITLDSKKKKTYSNFPWYALRENYLTSLTKFNAIPFPLLHEKKYIDDFCHLIDGLIITGGDFDINPKLYKTSNTQSKNIKNKRTNFEINIERPITRVGYNSSSNFEPDGYSLGGYEVTDTAEKVSQALLDAMGKFIEAHK